MGESLEERTRRLQDAWQRDRKIEKDPRPTDWDAVRDRTNRRRDK